MKQYSTSYDDHECLEQQNSDQIQLALHSIKISKLAYNHRVMNKKFTLEQHPTTYFKKDITPIKYKVQAH